MFKKLFNEKGDPDQKYVGKTLGLYEATRFIQDIILDKETWDEERLKLHQQIRDDANAGMPYAASRAQEIITEILREYGVKVDGMALKFAGYEIYKYIWGLDILEELYNDPGIDEIRVNRPDKIFVQRRGRNEKVDVTFKDEEHVKKIIGRLFFHDRGVALSGSTPVVESIRKDGTRVTATCPPVSSSWTLVLRKHGTFEMSPENLYESGTLNERLLNLIKVLVKGRVNILISGGTGSGKTSLLRMLTQFIRRNLRIVTLETDVELKLAQHYDERDIVELEEHADIGMTMNKLFRTILRYSPDIIIVGEIRGLGEAIEAIKACTRGHHGSMATVHFNSPQEAIEGCGKMMLEEGLQLPLDIAQTWAANAFDVVIQMFSDATKGVKKVIQVTEVRSKGEEVKFRDLVAWQQKGSEYTDGDWLFLKPPSEGLLEKMRMFGVSPDELRSAGVVI